MGVQDQFIVVPCPPVGLAQGHDDREGRPFPFSALDVNIAVHELDDALRNGHAQSGAAVFAGRGGVLLGEGIKEPGEVFFAHADARVADDEAQGGLAVKPRGLLHTEGDLPAFGREFHGVPQDIDHDLAELHVVADVIVPDISADDRLVDQALVPALAADNGVDLLKGLRKGKLLVVDRHPAGFDAGHVQDIVDDPQQVLGGVADLDQLLAGLCREVRIVQGDIVQADNGVHRRPDLMAHIGEEGGLGPVGSLCRLQSGTQRLVSGHGLAHLPDRCP